MSPPVRVLAIHRYYWPDTPPYASLLRSIIRRWTASGHSVDVLTSQPSYKPEAGIATRPIHERVDDAVVHRIGLEPDRQSGVRKTFNAVRFPLGVLVRMLTGRRYDVVMCSTSPPVLLGAVVALAARLRGTAFVYHCMDLHPEIGAISGEFRNKAVFSLLRRIDTATCASAAVVVVLSDDMRESLLRRSPALRDRIRVLNNFEIPSFESPGDEDIGLSLPPLPATAMRVVFTGNIGRFQGLETVAAAVLGPDPRLDDVQVVFMGDGSAKAGLRGLVASAPAECRDRVVFVPHGTVVQARELMRTAHLGLVSLVPGVIAYAYPSKTAAYLSEGLAVLVAVEANSALARDVTRWGIGGVLPTVDPQTTRRTLIGWLDRRQEMPLLSENARAAWTEHFAADTLLPQWDVLLAEVAQAGRRQ